MVGVFWTGFTVSVIILTIVRDVVVVDSKETVGYAIKPLLMASETGHTVV